MGEQTGSHFIKDLTPCPFCSGTAIYGDSVLIDDEELHFLICLGCGCEGPHAQEQATAQALWERRA